MHPNPNPLPTPEQIAEGRAMVELQFVNSDARPKATAIRCDTASIAPIMAWYGAFYAGDRYAVYADGEKLAKDRNGALVLPPTEGQNNG